MSPVMIHKNNSGCGLLLNGSLENKWSRRELGKGTNTTLNDDWVQPDLLDLVPSSQPPPVCLYFADAHSNIDHRPEQHTSRCTTDIDMYM